MPSDAARLAFARLKRDQASRVFYVHPCELKFVVKAGLDEWLDELDATAAEANYTADPSPAIEVPKARGHIRPGLALSLRDQFVYHLSALAASRIIRPAMDWSAYSVRFSYRISRRDTKYWFENEFEGWRNFDRVSIAKLFEEAAYVLVSDIAGYYDNIDIGRLVQELRAARVDENVCQQLSNLWNKWTGVRGRGIPQGLSPSHVFGEFFLDPVDSALRGLGITHLRYMDDLRLFGSTHSDAVRNLHELTRLLRARGLNTQTAKTNILEAAKARKRFGAVHRSLQRVSRKMAEELRILGELDGYVDPDTIREYMTADPDDPKPDVVERAWSAFVEGELGKFNKTLFHYLLSRLADQSSREAVSYCLALLVERPEETSHLLKYFSRVGKLLDRRDFGALAELLNSERILYDYQKYLILKWFYDEEVTSDIVLEFARSAVGGKYSRILRPHSIVYIGTHSSDRADFVRLERELQNETAALARATLLYGLKHAPATDRNTWYGRCAGEGALVDAGIACGKEEAS